ncbi:hypothetical protein [Autumnicola musiva]|uniref:PepSY domain-containing protein n=1 Tax=Autumnicola musiva TaxID=3075589 RepID=A0ABU3DA68_9FLAO|nr:hypothetical protein [Zunongwangia sp. F117]MDT0678435.1 hypothetical protein [Zunongwangia sp. F117]
MKKLGLSLIAAGAFFVSTNVAQAQETETQGEEEVIVEQETQQDGFESLEIMALPQAVKVAVIKSYEGATTESAWVKTGENGEKIYKLDINVDGQTQTVKADAEGNWIEDEN